MKWKSCVVFGDGAVQFPSVVPQGCILMLDLWLCHLCSSSSVFLMQSPMLDVSFTCTNQILNPNSIVSWRLVMGHLSFISLATFNAPLSTVQFSASSVWKCHQWSLKYHSTLCLVFYCTLKLLHLEIAQLRNGYIVIAAEPPIKWSLWYLYTIVEKKRSYVLVD